MEENVGRFKRALRKTKDTVKKKADKLLHRPTTTLTESQLEALEWSQDPKRQEDMYTLADHYAIFHSYLKWSIADKTPVTKVSGWFNNKLAQMDAGDFAQISGDLVEELQRRLACGTSTGVPPPGSGIPMLLWDLVDADPRRNSRRRALAMMDPKKFRLVVKDILCHTELWLDVYYGSPVTELSFCALAKP